MTDLPQETATAIGVDFSKYPLGYDTPITQYEVRDIYRLKTHRTCESWRRAGTGPKFFRVGQQPFYRLGDVIRWQEERVRRSTLEEAAR